MTNFEINNEVYEKSEDYILTSSAWVNALKQQTKTLILDFTIMWNMFEHQVFNNEFKSKYKKNVKCDECCEKILNNQENITKIDYVIQIINKYNEKYTCLEELYVSYGFQNSGLEFCEFEEIFDSDEYKTILKLLIYYCYRVRCNLFHGPKCVCDLDEQNLLFYGLNELMSIVAREYGY